MAALPVRWPASLSEAPPAVEAAPAEAHGPSLGIAAGGTPADGGLEAIFMEGLPFHGSPTKVFGYIALPPGLQPGERCPAMVLLHVSTATTVCRHVCHRQLAAV